MSLRKWVLLMLPISVAFIIGGYSGEILGKTEFFWPGAIVWATVIGIIDYNFSILKKMGTLAIVGRIVLVLSSAAITATVGDHILFKDTIANLKAEEQIADLVSAENDPDIVRLNGKINGLTSDIANYDAEIQRLSKEVTYEINNGGCKGKCEQKKLLLNDVKQYRVDAKADLAEFKEERKTKADFLKTQASSKTDRHDIIKEIQDLYGYIFDTEKRGYGGAAMFTIFFLMVICIETLPLILKSGITYNQIEREKAEAEAKRQLALRNQEANAAARKKEQDRIILRSNRI